MTRCLAIFLLPIVGIVGACSNQNDEIVDRLEKISADMEAIDRRLTSLESKVDAAKIDLDDIKQNKIPKLEQETDVVRRLLGENPSVIERDGVSFIQPSNEISDLSGVYVDPVPTRKKVAPSFALNDNGTVWRDRDSPIAKTLHKPRFSPNRYEVLLRSDAVIIKRKYEDDVIDFEGLRSAEIKFWEKKHPRGSPDWSRIIIKGKRSNRFGGRYYRTIDCGSDHAECQRFHSHLQAAWDDWKLLQNVEVAHAGAG